jgi:ribulose-5-phosphate 4-epimerase/fuculose-1-phosphate aldolase/predicted RNase H-like HicB family nuclease
LAHAIARRECSSDSVVLHTHVQNLVALARHPAASEQRTLNQALQEQLPALFLQDRGLIEEQLESIAVLPFLVTDTQCQIQETLVALGHHRAVLWKFHGLLVRYPTLPDCMRSMRLLDVCASAAFSDLLSGKILELPSGNQVAEIIQTYRSTFKSPDELLRTVSKMNTVPQFRSGENGGGRTGKEEPTIMSRPTHAVLTHIETLAGNQHLLHRKIPVTIQPSPQGDGYLAGFFDANIHTEGDNEQEAFENLRSLIVFVFDDLTAEPVENLGPEPARQLEVLRQFISLAKMHAR